jgi:Asp-tRNA(Asn)/Glu-tRNA(Gln) amidotransferase A subunit family amidase
VSAAVWELSAVQLRERFLAGELSPLEVTRALLDRIEERPSSCPTTTPRWSSACARRER